MEGFGKKGVRGLLFFFFFKLRKLYNMSKDKLSVIKMLYDNLRGLIFFFQIKEAI